MRTWIKLLIGAVVVAVVAIVGWRVFEHVDQQDKIKDANASCTTLDRPTVGRAGTGYDISGFSLPAGQKLLRVDLVGKTAVVYASTDGLRKDLVRIRDDVAKALQAQGFRRTGSDQEPTFEADATVTKNGVDDSINVRPLCRGRVVVRYTLHG